MKRIALAAVLVTACAPVAPLPGVPSGKCSTAALSEFIGKPATVDLANQALKRAGASVARAIGPNEAVTMEYREGRLNIHLDANNLVDHFTCG